MNPWDEWMEQHKDDPKKLPERIRQMHDVNGKTPGRLCGQCSHLRRLRYHRRTYNKCELTKWTHGAGTDWMMRWPACGKFEELQGKREAEYAG